MTEIPMALEINCTTGEEILRPLTAEEIAQREVDAAQAEAEKVAKEVAKAAVLVAKESAQSKLAALGLTAEEIAALTK